MFKETKDHIKKELKKHTNIGLTTDAWTSMVQQSYITVTAHIIDENSKQVSYVLDTSEIKERHTSENLMDQLHKVLKDYDINTGSETQHKIIYNFNATNLNNIHEEDQKCDDEPPEVPDGPLIAVHLLLSWSYCVQQDMVTS